MVAVGNGYCNYDLVFKSVSQAHCYKQKYQMILNLSVCNMHWGLLKDKLLLWVSGKAGLIIHLQVLKNACFNFLKMPVLTLGMTIQEITHENAFLKIHVPHIS